MVMEGCPFVWQEEESGEKNGGGVGGRKPTDREECHNRGQASCKRRLPSPALWLKIAADGLRTGGGKTPGEQTHAARKGGSGRYARGGVEKGLCAHSKERRAE